MSTTPPIRPAELAEHLYDNAGREITQNFETMNSNMSLAAGGIAALVTVIGAGQLFKGKVQSHVPSLSAISLILLVAVFPLVYRFFFRSLIAYQNLRRFNLVQNKMVRYLRGQDDWTVASGVVDQYLDRWCTPISFPRAVLENLKYGFFWIFAILGAAIGWGFYSTQGEDARVVAGTILAIGLVWEAATLPGFVSRYFKPADGGAHRSLRFHVGKALTRTVRAFLLTWAGTSLTMLIAAHVWNFKATGLGWRLALYASIVTGVLTLLANLLEDNSAINLGAK